MQPGQCERRGRQIYAILSHTPLAPHARTSLYLRPHALRPSPHALSDPRGSAPVLSLYETLLLLFLRCQQVAVASVPTAVSVSISVAVAIYDSKRSSFNSADRSRSQQASGGGRRGDGGLGLINIHTHTYARPHTHTEKDEQVCVGRGVGG
eukprot:COSAG02_NODE_999_length_15328_cov_8.086360_9_plen_151_part_00